MTVPVTITTTMTAGLAALLLAVVLTDLMRRVALRYGFTDRPGARKAHRRATPYLGGIAIAAAALVPAVLLVPARDVRFVTIVVAGAVLVAVGLVDDVRSLAATPRLLVEGLAASAVVLSGVRLDLFGGPADEVLTVCWIVVITNSFNLLDNMDGMAATVAGTASGLLALNALASSQIAAGTLLAALSASCAGFLVHNWSPARIFMGDAGSLFIGFLISTSAVLLAPAGGLVPTTAWLALIAFVALIDTTLVLVSRQRAGRPWLTGGTDHVSHRLRRVGLSIDQVALLFFATTAVSGTAALLVAGRSLPPPAALLGVLAGGAALVVLLLRVPGYPGLAERPPTRRRAACPAGLPAAAAGPVPVTPPGPDWPGTADLVPPRSLPRPDLMERP